MQRCVYRSRTRIELREVLTGVRIDKAFSYSRLLPTSDRNIPRFLATFGAASPFTCSHLAGFWGFHCFRSFLCFSLQINLSFIKIFTKEFSRESGYLSFLWIHIKEILHEKYWRLSVCNYYFQ